MFKTEERMRLTEIIVMGHVMKMSKKKKTLSSLPSFADP